MPSNGRAALVVIVDDHELARGGLRSLLAGAPQLTVAGEAANAADALDLCTRIRPDLVLLDLKLGDSDSLALIHAIHEVCPHTRVLIVSMFDGPSYRLAAEQAGATGYIVKGATRRQVLSAVRRALGHAAGPATTGSSVTGTRTA